MNTYLAVLVRVGTSSSLQLLIDSPDYINRRELKQKYIGWEIFSIEILSSSEAKKLKKQFSER